MQTSFLSWCTAQGITTPLQLKGADSSYRYLACETDLKPGDILNVPLHACITADTREDLAERLAHERSLGSESKYAPYIDAMPTMGDGGSLDSMPRFWAPQRRETLAEFDGGEVEKRIARDERKELDPWAYACVSSRSNYLSDMTFSLTPLLDMLNHDTTVGTTARITDGELSLAVQNSFSAGEEVFISYGTLSNIDTLCDYGFVTPNNLCNVELIEVRLIRCPSLAVSVFSDGSIDNGAIATLRQYLANTEELESQQGGGESRFFPFSKPVSERNELEVFSFLASSLDEAASLAISGAQAAADDSLVADYLNARAETLKKGIVRIEEKYPELEY